MIQPSNCWTVRYFSEETLFLIGAYIHASYLKQRSSYNCPRFQVQESSMFFCEERYYTCSSTEKELG